MSNIMVGIRVSVGDYGNLTNDIVFIAQGVILVYDIANRWSFDGIDRWIKEIDEVSDQSIITRTLRDPHEFLKLLFWFILCFIVTFIVLKTKSFQ